MFLLPKAVVTATSREVTAWLPESRCCRLPTSRSNEQQCQRSFISKALSCSRSKSSSPQMGYLTRHDLSDQPHAHAFSVANCLLCRQRKMESLKSGVCGMLLLLSIACMLQQATCYVDLPPMCTTTNPCSTSSAPVTNWLLTPYTTSSLGNIGIPDANRAAWRKIGGLCHVPINVRGGCTPKGGGAGS